MYNSCRLFRAAEMNDLPNVKNYISYKDDLNVICGNYNPLWTAASQGHANIVKCLLDNGAKTDSPLPRWHDNLLFFAIKNGHLNVVLTLIEAGFDINQTNNKGLTPLQYAKRLHQQDIVMALENLNTNKPSLR